ncbi:RHS repeat protein [Stenotrophomonas rhizophila]|uniref:RHS repeat protein n=1 Tax=Stenotrophomonas rhizophila TaxID=216778 RepID=UPI001E56C6A7|nr:RHS repeat protein [Stenotrophomonas rhizophila]MCC7633395.1 RHS repeat protein [Stenotrophomonas rhizophila]MCC7663119.1 RHS repeat protein [Stenotrophomonas rhizophila]
MQARIWRLRIAVVAVVGAAVLPATAVEPYQEYRKLVESAQNLTALQDDLFGEKVNLYTGKTQFLATDIDLPGNNSLPVRLTRRFSVEVDLVGTPASFNANIDGVGGWEVDVPHISGTFGGAGSWPDTRCSVSMAPTYNIAFKLTDIWQGNTIHIPDGGDRVMLLAEANTPRPNDGVARKWSTSQRDAIDCIPMRSGLTGEGYRVGTTEGLSYYFDTSTTRYAGTLEKSLGGASRARSSRERIYLLATRVEDRFGNWVQYAYNGDGRPVRVWSSDGREINLVYNGNLLATASAAGRTWSYSHGQVDGADRLAAVVRPDGSRWTYSYSSALRVSSPFWDGNTRPGCGEQPPELNATLKMIIGHPSGAVGEFNLRNARHYRSGIHASECSRKTANNGSYYYELATPNFFDVVSLFSKTITGPGINAPLRWSYGYDSGYQALWGNPDTGGVYPCTTCKSEKTVSVTNPDGSSVRYRYGSQYALNEGRLLGSSNLDAAGSVLRSNSSLYMTSNEVANQPFAPRFGIIWNGEDPSTAEVRPVVVEAIEQDGVSYQTSMLAFDDMARPTRVNQSSPTGFRTDVTEFQDERGRWILGSVAKVINAETGVTVEQTQYDELMRPMQVLKYGKVAQRLTWNGDGTVAAVIDGNGNVTNVSGWKRGIPQSIGFADGTSRSALVDDNGWLTSVTDEVGTQIGYEYDPMGRVSGINWPTGDTTAWAKTTQSFEQVAGTEHGIGAGHWRQTTATGNARKYVYFDAFWRPLVTEEYDAAQQGATQRFQRFAYDEAGRQAFASQPSTSPAVSVGVWTTYDALGRARSASVDSEQGLLTTLTDYLAGGQVRITNPRGQSTTTRFQAFGGPSTDAPLSIAHPEGVVTEIERDVFGKPRSITRRSQDGSTRLTRSYVYDGNQLLCKSVEPETGSTLMAYDGAGNLAWSAAGLDLPATDSCDAGAAAATARQVIRRYDARNRVTNLHFPDINGDQNWEYTPDGKPLKVYTLSEGGTSHAANSYIYNKRGLISAEYVGEMTIGSEVIQYAYDPGGALASITYPSGRQVDYAPNALGQATKAGSYASNVQYYPNGGMKQFTYGNGLVHSMAQNARQLPARVTDGGGALDTTYEYDANGNVGRIVDHLDADRTRTMAYDGLDRLVSADSPSFGGDGAFRYTYDALDNIRSARLGGVKDHGYWYDARNRMTNVQNSGGATTIALDYDVQGNMVKRNGAAFVFDFGNRLLQATGAESYRYDMHGRRLLQLATDGSASIWSFYGSDGLLKRQRNYRAGTSVEYVHLNGSLVAEATQYIAPAVPTITVPAFSGTGAFEVSWTAAATADSYELREQIDSAPATDVFSGAGRSWSTSARPGGTYAYTVRACLQMVCGAWSAPARVAVQLPPATAPQVFVPGVSGGGTIALSWTAVAGASNYCVTEQIGTGASASLQCVPGQTLTLTARPAGSYNYGVHGCNAAGCGPSSMASTTVVYAPGSAPVLSVPTTSLGGTYTVSWAPVSGAEVYGLEESVNGGGWALVVSHGSTSQAFGNKPTGNYAYRVRAGNAAGWGAYSAEGAVMVIQPPTAPSLSAPGSSSNGSITVSWTPVPMAVSYLLEQSVDGGAWTGVQHDGSTQATRTGLGFATYLYQVKACNEAGCSGYSNTASVVSTPPPATPQITYSLQTRWRIARLYKQRCDMKWSTSVGATSYQLQVPGGNLQYDGPATSVSSPRDSSNYCAPIHVIRACNASGCSAWSDPPTPQPINDLGDLDEDGGGVPR